MKTDGVQGLSQPPALKTQDATLQERETLGAMSQTVSAAMAKLNAISSSGRWMANAFSLELERVRSL